MKTNIALIGFMGTGKTVVGRLLAEMLEMRFVETDALIEQKAGKTIRQIFDEDGEVAFRELEIEAVKAVANETRTVIACGGGVVLNNINIQRLRKKAVVVCLTASPTVTFQRVSRRVGQRPLLDVEDPLSTIRAMMKFRKPFYERSADVTVDTSHLGTRAVAEAIVRRLEEDESLDWSQ